MTKDQNLTAPAQGPGTEPAVQPSREPQYEYLVAAHLIAAAPGRFLENTRLEATMGRATCDLYERLAPRDAQNSILSLLTVSVTNASLDCLALAARVPPDNLAVRELNLRYGLKAAEVAAQLIRAREVGIAKSPIGCQSAPLTSRREARPSLATSNLVGTRCRPGCARIGSVMASTHPRNWRPMVNSPRCGAKTRKGESCRAPAVTGKNRCLIVGAQRLWRATRQ